MRLEMKKLSSIILVVMVLCTVTGFAQEFETGSFAVSVNDYGRMRAYTPGLAGLRQIERSSVLVGLDATAVFDYLQDADTEIAPYNVATPENSDYEIFGAFNNAYSMAPPAVTAEENFYGWTGGSYCLVKYNIVSGEHSAEDFIFGMEIIPYIDYVYGGETTEFLSESATISIHRDNSYIGYRFLAPELTSLVIFEWYDGYNEVEADLWNWLNHGSIDDYFLGGVEGAVLIPALDPVNIAPGESSEMYFAIAYAANETDLLTNLDLAQEAYENNFVGVAGYQNLTPDGFSLSQNYPNPFNPSTSIDFILPQASLVNLTVYNVLGKEVSEIISGWLPEGAHTVTFDASALPSAVYFYRLQAGGFEQMKKMVLLK